VSSTHDACLSHYLGKLYSLDLLHIIRIVLEHLVRCLLSIGSASVHTVIPGINLCMCILLRQLAARCGALQSGAT